MNQQVNDILNEIKKVIVGKDEVISKVFMAMLSGGSSSDWMEEED